MKHILTMLVASILLLLNGAFSQQSYIYVDFPANELWKATTTEYPNWNVLDFDHSNWPAAVPIKGFAAVKPVIAENSISSNTMYMRGELNFTYEELGTLQKILIMIKANTSYDLYFNGIHCGIDSTWPHGPLKVYDVTSIFNSSGKNVIAVKGWVISSTQPSVYCVVRLEYPSSVITPITNVIESRTIPTDISLSQNYPNPFNPTTSFEYNLNKRGDVLISIFNELGQHVITLVDEKLEPGKYNAKWDGKTLTGVVASSGTYFYQLTVDGSVQTKKMILVK